MKLQLSLFMAVAATLTVSSQARSYSSISDDASISGVIPSPNQEDDSYALATADIQRASAATSPQQIASAENSAQPSDESSIPVYVSPFARPERGATPVAAPVSSVSSFDRALESNIAPPNYAPRPAGGPNDLKTSASYGHGHHHGHGHGYGDHGGHGYDHSGWLDMGAWTGGKGSFGWYADYPVGGKHHGYGKK